VQGLDTNVLVRYFVRDDLPQYQIAKTLIEKAVRKGQLLFVPLTVVLELEWVLRSRYAFAKTDIIAILANMLASVELVLDQESAIEKVLIDYQMHTIDFADSVHGAICALAGAVPMWTFDEKAARLPAMKLLK
jgi:predicted nucleic-acid-binding protein